MLLLKNGKIESIIGKSCKFFYDSFVDEKFQKPHMETVPEKDFFVGKIIFD
jgi:competence transcription factor ComK